MSQPSEQSAAPAQTDNRSNNRPNAQRRGVQRRRRIFKSLHDNILARGYVKTTLAEIAEGAGMTASHLLYYFNGKEDILEQYFANVSVRFLERIDGFGAQPPQQQLQSLADFWFKGETSTVEEIGFMLECFGAAVNDERLRITKAEFDDRCKAHLAQIFAASPAVLLQQPKDAAEIAYALMIGLRSAVYFDDDIDLDDAHRLFLATTYAMCGFAE